jgi:tetraacyldisaccharide-1-P 4'-kinase
MNIIPNIVRNYVLLKLPRESRVGTVEIQHGSIESGDEGIVYAATNIQADVDKDKWDAITVVVTGRDTEITVADRIVMAYNFYTGDRQP